MIQLKLRRASIFKSCLPCYPRGCNEWRIHIHACCMFRWSLTFHMSIAILLSNGFYPRECLLHFLRWQYLVLIILIPSQSYDYFLAFLGSLRGLTNKLVAITMLSMPYACCAFQFIILILFLLGLFQILPHDRCRSAAFSSSFDITWAAK